MTVYTDCLTSPVDIEALEKAIARSHEFWLSRQHPEGFWNELLIVDTTVLSDTIMLTHWLGWVDREREKRGVRHLLKHQLSDGGWNIYHEGPSELNATVKAYWALKLSGMSPEDEILVKARKRILELGGIPKCNTFQKLYLALWGQISWECVPTIPCELSIIPAWFYLNLYELSSWTRGIVVPLAILNHYRPVKMPNRAGDISELYPEGTNPETARLPYDKKLFTFKNFFLGIDQVLKWHERFPLKPWRKKSLSASEKWMLDHFEQSDGLAAIYPAIANSVLAMKVLGYADDHPQVRRAWHEIEKLFVDDGHEWWVQPCKSPVWDTAITVIAMEQSGFPSDHPALQKAAQWLVEREIRMAGDWKFKNQDPVEPSGWAFEFNNAFYPDVDDTAMVLMALSSVELPHPGPRDAACRRGLNWLLSFQCKDGGYAAFDRDVMKAVLQEVPFADHNAVLDPSCSDISAKVLELMGKLKFESNNIRAQRIIEFLKRNQEADGSWFGRWGVNYIYGTWQVLRGLRAIGYDMSQPWVQKAKHWLESIQHADGGWGERCNTYDNPTQKGNAPVSTASQTAWAVMALCSFGNPECPGLVRGVEWLIQHQNPDGSWTELETTGTGFPKVYYLKYDSYRNNFTLLALGSYRKLLGLVV